MAISTRSKSAPFPTREQIVEFIRGSETRVGKREIARAFRLNAEQKVELRRVLKELETEGDIGRGRGRRYQDPSALPSVAVIEISGVDTDGETTARPFGWTEGPPPMFRRPGSAAAPPYAPGERVLARLKQTEPGAYEARVMRRLAAPPDRTLGVVTQVGESMRIVPVEKRARAEFLLPPEARMGAEAGELVWAEIQPGRPLGLKSARVVERLGPTMGPKSISLITIHDHDIPHTFSDDALAQAKAAGPAQLRAGSICESCLWSPSTARTRATSTTPYGPSRTRTPATAAAGTCWWRSPMSPTTCGRVVRWTRRRSIAAIPSTSPTASCRCCRTSCRMAGARWCRPRTVRALRALVDRRRRHSAAPPLRARDDALGGAADLSAGAGHS